MRKKTSFNSIDLFSGCGGLSAGMRRAGFQVKVGVEIDKYAVQTFRLNFPKAQVISDDIRNVNTQEIKDALNGEDLHLLAGCPPCQGFSSLRRLNKRQSVKDSRNALVLEYLRLVRELKPLTVMMENVPGLENYYHFRRLISELRSLGYNPSYHVVNVKDYGVPQNRKRLVLVGSLLGTLEIAEGNGEKATVRKRIGNLESITETNDPLHKITAQHTDKVQRMIELIPKDGGSRRHLPEEYVLDCHKKEGVGFNDVYGRLRWDDYSTTITGGCLNPSKGRFLHPEENRVITPREASMLQSFAKNYKFPVDIPKSSIALLIGNALPPKFSYYQSRNIYNHIDKHLSV